MPPVNGIRPDRFLLRLPGKAALPLTILGCLIPWLWDFFLPPNLMAAASCSICSSRLNWRAGDAFGAALRDPPGDGDATGAGTFSLVLTRRAGEATGVAAGTAVVPAVVPEGLARLGQKGRAFVLLEGPGCRSSSRA